MHSSPGGAGSPGGVRRGVPRVPMLGILAASRLASMSNAPTPTKPDSTAPGSSPLRGASAAAHLNTNASPSGLQRRDSSAVIDQLLAKRNEPNQDILHPTDAFAGRSRDASSSSAQNPGMYTPSPIGSPRPGGAADLSKTSNTTAASASFLSPRIEATVQLLQEGVHDVDENEYENESQQRAIASHKESLADSTRRREELKKRSERTQTEMRDALAKANMDISNLQFKIRAAVDEKDQLTKSLHAEKMKVVDVKEDLEEAQEKNLRLERENDEQEKELAGLKQAIEARARKRAGLRQHVQQLFVGLEWRLRDNLMHLESEMRSLYITGGASTAASAIDYFLVSKGREGPCWMADGASSYKMLIQKHNLVPEWLEEVVLKFRKERGRHRSEHTQTWETGESRKQDSDRTDATIDALKSELHNVQQELEELRRETDLATMNRDQSDNELNAARARADALAQELQQRDEEEDRERRRMQSELDARDDQERHLRDRITDLERELRHTRREFDRERGLRADAVRTAVWIEQVFQLLEDEEREMRRRIIALEAEEVADRLAPVHAALVHEAARQRRELIHTRSHLRALTPPRSMSGITGKKPWYPPPGPPHSQTISPARSFTPQRSSTPARGSKSPGSRGGGSPSISAEQRTASAFTRANSARLAMGVEQMQSILEDLQKYTPSKKPRAAGFVVPNNASSLRPKSWEHSSHASGGTPITRVNTHPYPHSMSLQSLPQPQSPPRRHAPPASSSSSGPAGGRGRHARGAHDDGDDTNPGALQSAHGGQSNQPRGSVQHFGGRGRERHDGGDDDDYHYADADSDPYPSRQMSDPHSSTSYSRRAGGPASSSSSPREQQRLHHQPRYRDQDAEEYDGDNTAAATTTTMTTTDDDAAVVGHRGDYNDRGKYSEGLNDEPNPSSARLDDSSSTASSSDVYSSQHQRQQQPPLGNTSADNNYYYSSAPSNRSSKRIDASYFTSSGSPRSSRQHQEKQHRGSPYIATTTTTTRQSDATKPSIGSEQRRTQKETTQNFSPSTRPVSDQQQQRHSRHYHDDDTSDDTNNNNNNNNNNDNINSSSSGSRGPAYHRYETGKRYGGGEWRDRVGEAPRTTASASSPSGGGSRRSAAAAKDAASSSRHAHDPKVTSPRSHIYPNYDYDFPSEDDDSTAAASPSPLKPAGGGRR